MYVVGLMQVFVNPVDGRAAVLVVVYRCYMRQQSKVVCCRLRGCAHFTRMYPAARVQVHTLKIIQA
eukprot:2316116-Pleurochrysis_carterae.AAC.1